MVWVEAPFIRISSASERVDLGHEGLPSYLNYDALPEEVDLIPSTDMATVSNSSSKGICHPLLASVSCMHVVYSYTCRQNTQTHKIKIKTVKDIKS